MNWHKRKDGWEAWAPAAYPRDKFPPRYTLTLVDKHQTKREVHLVRSGLCRTLVGEGANLEEAKALAEADYQEHQYEV